MVPALSPLTSVGSDDSKTLYFCFCVGSKILVFQSDHNMSSTTARIIWKTRIYCRRTYRVLTWYLSLPEVKDLVNEVIPYLTTCLLVLAELNMTLINFIMHYYVHTYPKSTKWVCLCVCVCVDGWCVQSYHHDIRRRGGYVTK